MAAAPVARAQHHEHAMPMQGFFGDYPMSREASGTSWQPESTPVEGHHFMKGSWMLMIHGFADVVYDNQGGPRGDSAVFGPTMGMLMAQRPAGRGTFGLRAMTSLDPLAVGRRGYPLLLQTGETADGRTPLVDRQHPHDLFMELAASYSARAGGASLYGYLGYPGEPALGPPAFMHRFSGATMPESPLGHHWLDSTHITFGVATLGVSWNRVKLEGSSFTGREPDERRWSFDRPRFDSYAGRATLNPTTDWSFQLSAGHMVAPEPLEPNVDVDRFTASASYNRRLAKANWQTTLAWGRNRKKDRSQDALILETTWSNLVQHTIFARAEMVEKDELFEDGPLARTIFRVGKLSAGYVYDFAHVDRVSLGAGVLGSTYRIPGALRPTYGRAPASFMVFLRGVVR
jgi:hypothetical protein